MNFGFSFDVLIPAQSAAFKRSAARSLALLAPRAATLYRVLPVMALMLIMLSGFPTLSTAQRGDSGAPTALFTVDNLVVKGVGDGSEAARQRAFELAHIAALREVVSRVAPPGEIEQLPLPSNDALTALVDELNVIDEQMNELTYVGLMRFEFKQDALTEFLSSNGVRFSVAQARPLLVIPILNVNGNRLLWESQNAWANAWRAPEFSQTLQPFIVPSGNAEDRDIFELSRLRREDVPQAARRLADRYDAAGVLLAEARLDVALTGQLQRATAFIVRTGGGSGPERLEVTEDAQTGDRPLDVLTRAARDVVTRYSDAWRNSSAIVGAELTTLTFETDNADLEAWFALEQILRGVAVVQSVDLLTLGTNQVIADLTFQGRLDQLTRILAQRQIDLIPAGERFLVVRR